MKHKNPTRHIKFNLRPCPFCGGKAVLLHDGYADLGGIRFETAPLNYHVECERCGARTQKSTIIGHIGDKSVQMTACVQAVAWWNRRADHGE